MTFRDPPAPHSRSARAAEAAPAGWGRPRWLSAGCSGLPSLPPSCHSGQLSRCPCLPVPLPFKCVHLRPLSFPLLALLSLSSSVTSFLYPFQPCVCLPPLKTMVAKVASGHSSVFILLDLRGCLNVSVLTHLDFYNPLDFLLCL